VHRTHAYSNRQINHTHTHIFDIRLPKCYKLKARKTEKGWTDTTRQDLKETGMFRQEAHELCADTEDMSPNVSLTPAGPRIKMYVPGNYVYNIINM